ncbi:HU family DNA-binding protein [Phocaeicola sp.]
MAVQYDLYTIPDPQDAENELYHVRVVPDTPMTPKMMEKRIEERCTLTTTDVKAALSALSDIMKEELLQGRRVHLRGIGYFYLTLKAVPTDNDAENMQKVRAPQVDIKSVTFRPEKELIEDMRKASEFCPPKAKRHSSKQTDISVMDILTNYFADHEELDRTVFERLCGFRRSTALRWLKRLVEEGKLKNIANKHAPRYRAVPGNFGVSRDQE